MSCNGHGLLHKVERLVSKRDDGFVLRKVKGEAATGVMTRGTPSSRATRIFVFTPVVRSTGTIINRHESTSVSSSSEER